MFVGLWWGGGTTFVPFSVGKERFTVRQVEQLYADKQLRRRVCCLPQPGFRGYFAPPLARSVAHQRLGLPLQAGCVYLCLAYRHTEREVLQLIEAFLALKQRKSHQKKYKASSPMEKAPQLLLVGSPPDKKRPTRVLQLAASDPTIHLCMSTPRKEEMPLYLGAADALVLPHVARKTAGTLETAMLALSYERSVVVPDLPRFHGMLPFHASILYNPASRESLVQALLTVQTRGGPTDRAPVDETIPTALEATTGWQQYAQRLTKLYYKLL